MSPSRVGPARSPISSLKKLLRHTPQKPLPPLPETPKALIERLPTHIIWAISRQLSPWDVLHWGLCSRRLRTLLSPALYSRVELKTNKHCKTALITFSKHPEITQHIRRLIVRVNPVEWTDPDEEMDEDLVATLIIKLSTKLQGLEAFEWDGLEMPRDELWLALKTSCRHLKRISTTIGDDPLSTSSTLWDFDDLRQISLTVKCQSLDWLSEGLPKTEKLPRKFWAMLLERCPRLEELKIGGAAPSPRMFDIRHVMNGRWPRLRRLTLGDMVLVSPAKGEEQVQKDHSAFMAFFAAHPALRGIHLQHAAASIYFPTTFVLPPTALSNVTSFSGPLTLLRTLPNIHRLQDLTLTTPHHAASSFHPTFAVLRDLKDLLSLNIWVDLSFGSLGSLASSRTSGESMRKSSASEDIQMLRSLAASIQNLKHLDISCFTRPTFYIRDFSRFLQAMPNLESFRLTKLCKSNEEDLTKSTARIVTENRHIKHFTIRLTCDSWFSSTRGRVKHQGTYEVFGHTVRSSPLDGDPGNKPTLNESIAPTATVLAHECGQKSITGKDYSRHFIHEVLPKPREMPPSSFGRHRHSLSLSRLPSLTRPSDASCGSDSGSDVRTHSRSNSLSSSFFGRVRRRSSSSAGGSIAGANVMTTVASPRSSISSVSPSAASHCSVAWADRDVGSLGRSGSTSTSGTGTGSGSSPHDVSAIIEDGYVLV